MTPLQDARTAKYYDSIAPLYDAQLDAVESNRNARTHFREIMSSLVREGASIVDFGCGTGTDTAWYADHGYSVVAYDISTGMSEMVRERCAQHIAAGRVVVVDGEIHRLWSLLDQSAKVSAVAANFAVFNHIHNLRFLFDALAARIAPGGVVIAQVLNPFYARDVRRFWWWRSAVRSLGSGAIKFSGRDTTTYRHFSWSVIRAARPHFVFEPQPRSSQFTNSKGFWWPWILFRPQFSIFVFRRRE